MPPSSITVLSLPTAVKKKLLTTAELVHQQLDQLRKWRFLRRSVAARQKRITETHGAATHRPATATRVLHRVSTLLRRLLRRPSRRQDDASTSRTRTSSTTTSRARRLVHRLLGAMSRVLRAPPRVQQLLTRIRSLASSAASSAAALRLPLRLSGARPRQRRLRGVWWTAAVLCGVLRARASRRRRQRAAQVLAPHVAAAFVGALLQDRRIVDAVVSHRQRRLQHASAVVIACVWRQWKARQSHHRQRKHALLALLAHAQTQLEHAEQHSHMTRDVAHSVATQTVALVDAQLRKRSAVRLLQRVWRGSRARARVIRLLSDQKRRAFLRLQRERLRRARAALLSPTPHQVVEQRVLETRKAARCEPTPLVKRAARVGGALARGSLHQPLSVQHRAPRISAATGAKVLPVTVAKFEKIRSRHVRVNPLNVWVAIPVGYTQQEEVKEEEEEGGEDKGEHGVVERTRSRTGGRGPRRSKYLQTKFDWVPATLLAPLPSPTN